MELTLPLITDFEVTAEEDRGQYYKIDWQPLTRLPGGESRYRTRFKAAYSASGIYFLVDCEDRQLSCSPLEDFDDLYNEDVLEVFLWPVNEQILCFEYEVSPLGKELPLLIPNNRGTFMGWRPWHYEGERCVRKAVQVHCGKQSPAASIEGWTTEIFIPFALLTGLGCVPPSLGSVWRMNVYRMDYDQLPRTQWAWSPVKNGEFHRYNEFGTVRFG